MKNKDHRNEINELKAELEYARKKQQQLKELIQLQKELKELKNLIDEITGIYDQSKVEIVKRDGRE